MNYQLELDDFTDEGLMAFVKEIKNSDKYFVFDEGEIEDLTDEGDELFNTIEVEGKDWEDYCKGISPSLDDPGMPPEGGYYNDVNVQLYIDGEYKEISQHLRSQVIENIIEKLSEERLDSY